ncbi:MAG: hypothetical protein K8U03_24230 [Planctomycetia bacterium]|nr:hypothetical protein [Planctomycetia bacterium]
MTIDPAKSKLAAEFKHDVPLMSCAFDMSGRYVIAGGRDRNVVAFEATTGRKTILTGHESWVGIATRAADLVLTADYAGRVVAWDCSGNGPESRWKIDAHPSTIYGLAAAVDGKTFATGDREGVVRVWRTADGKQLHELSRIEYPVYGVALHPDGKRIVTADRQPQKPRIKVWDLASGTERLSIDVAELSGYRRVEDIEWGGIRALAVSPDGAQIVACGRTGYDGQACALSYEASTGKLQRKSAVALKGGFYYSAKFHAEGFLVTAGGDLGKGEFRCWKPNSDESLAHVSTSGPCLGMDIDSSGTKIAVAQAIGSKTYPESGALAVFEWSK